MVATEWAKRIVVGFVKLMAENVAIQQANQGPREYAETGLAGSQVVRPQVTDIAGRRLPSG